MKTKSITEKILEVESALDVRQFNFRGVSIWPVIRMSMYLSSKGSVASGSSKTLIWRKGIFLLSGIIQWIRWMFRALPKADTFCLSSAHYKITENGQRHDRILEPFLEWMDNHDEKFLVAEFANTYQYTDSLPYAARVLRVQPLIFFLSLWWRIAFRLTSKRQVSGDIKKLNNLLKQLEIRFQMNKSFEWKMYSLLKQSELFERLLRITNARRVLLVCYYDSKSLALTWAANRLQLPVMDIQHGVQGPHHLAYAKWPPLTDKFRPSHFWVWDEYSAKTIAEWKQDVNNILLGCNRWFMDRVQETAQEILLFTAQPLDDPLPRSLMDSIRSYKGRRQWYIRLHPYQLQQMALFEKRFSDEGLLEKVNIRGASQMPLTEVLSRTHLHMTYFSSVAVEAAYFNVPTIFFDHRGEEVFGNSLPSDLLYSVTSDVTLLDYLAKFEARQSNLNKDDVATIRNRFAIIKKFFV